MSLPSNQNRGHHSTGSSCDQHKKNQDPGWFTSDRAQLDNQQQHPPVESISGQSPAPRFMEFDDLFTAIGPFGRYQFFVAFCIQYSCLMLAGNFYMMTFGTLKPKWTCLSTDNSSNQQDYCHYIQNCTTENGTNALYVESEFYSITQQWQLICDKDYIPNLIISIQMLGQTLACPVVGHLMDYFGRKWIFLIGFICCILCGLICPLAPNWQMLTVFLFIMGFGFGMYDAIGILSMEITGKNYRLIMNCAFQWVISSQLVALIAYLSKDWRSYILIINGLCVPLAILMFFMDESPRWLIQKKKFHNAAIVLNKIARWNKKEAVDIGADNLKAIQLDQRKTYSLFVLFSTKRLALYTVISILTAFFYSIVTGTILFNVGNLAGSPFLNVALYGLLRIWAPPLLTYLEIKGSHSGRRPMFLGSLAFVLACFVSMIIIYSTCDDDPNWHIVASVLAIVGNCVNAGILNVAMCQYGVELFPTVLRGIANGTIKVSENIGFIVAPQLLYLQKYWSQLPYFIVALIGLVAFVGALIILPETAGRPLPDTMMDMKKIQERSSAANSTDQ